MGNDILHPPMVIDIKSMLKYYEEFDSVHFKYKKLLGDNITEEYYINFSNYEESQQFEELTKKEFHNLQANLDMAYSDEKTTDDFFKIYDLMAEKIVRRYINIDGIERLFSEKYASFEWEMHLGMDHKKHSMKFYRDHFIHQIKDAYMMIVLLEKAGYYNKVREMLLDTSCSKVSRYVCKMLEQQGYQYKKKVFEHIEDESLKEHFLYNIIYMASYMAGLFHDIGYPTVANMKEHRKMIDYLTETHYFEKGNYNFNQIMALLQNSLLFRVVSPAEIRERIEGDDIDHGTISALLFLLHFYENGAIYKLEPYKLCAVELAGLAIYNHTNRYANIGQEKANYERCVFALNPISYLLRVCDDLQEWGRIYFEVSNQSNLILCDRCYMPIRRLKKQNTVFYQCRCKKRMDSLFSPIFQYYDFPYRKVFNVSVCSSLEVNWDENFENYNFYLKYDLSKLLHIAYINQGYARYRIKELEQMKKLFPRQSGFGLIFVNYFITANIILIKSAIVGEYLYKTYRRSYRTILQEIENIILPPVSFDGKSAFEEIQQKMQIFLKEFKAELFSDIICKEKIIGRNKAKCKKFKDQIEKYSETKEEDYQVLIKDLETKNISLEDKKEHLIILRNYLYETFHTYVFIACMMQIGKKANTKYPKICQEVQKRIKELLELLGKKEVSGQEFCNQEVKILIDDCRVQIGNMYANLSNYTYYPKNYFRIFQPEQQKEKWMEKEKEEIYYDTLARFTDIENYKGVYNIGDMKLDAYTDLYWIRKILIKIGQAEIISLKKVIHDTKE